MYNRFRDIPQFTRTSPYIVTQPWSRLSAWLEEMQAQGLQLNPDFQRGHVWTRAQQTAYVEFVLRGGQSGRDVLFNFPGFSHGLVASPGNPEVGEFVCVDGLQRITAAMAFVRNEIPAFGKLFREYDDRLDTGVHFRVHVNDLATREEVLQWYLEINSGGTPHTQQELERVRGMLEAAAQPERTTATRMRQ